MKKKLKRNSPSNAAACSASEREQYIADKAIMFLSRDPHCVGGTVEQAVNTAIIRMTDVGERVNRRNITREAKRIIREQNETSPSVGANEKAKS